MVLVVLVVLMALASPAAADEGSWTERWLTQSTLTGNWFGARDTLAAWGIDVSGDWASGTDLSVDIGNVFTAASVSVPRSRWVIRSPSLLLATWMTLRRRQRSRGRPR